MTKIVVQPNASGTGTFTIAAPNSNNARTLTLPDAAGTVFLSDGSGTIQPTNITDGTTSVGTSYVVNGSAKAWVRVNISAAIVDSFNVASITDNGTGNNTANLTSSMANASFSAAGCINYDNNGIVWVRNQAVSSFNVRTYIPTVPNYFDLEWGASIHGDLA